LLRPDRFRAVIALSVPHLVQGIFSRKVYASILPRCWEKSSAN
jgi:hypothetical protein